jgi:phytoene desaturase
VYFDASTFIDVPADPLPLRDTFEKIEQGAGQHLSRFLELAASNYRAAMTSVVYKPGRHPFELITAHTVLQAHQFFQTIRSYVHRNFRDPRLRQLLEFPILFLGAKPDTTPLFYCFMNHADLELGTWYPKGGMRSVVGAMVQLAGELGVSFHYNAEVSKIMVDSSGTVTGIEVNGEAIPSHVVIAGADYAHAESLLEPRYRSYTEQYWDTRILAPSALLFFVGFSKRLQNVEHHTLFFDAPFDGHAQQIYDQPAWPDHPLFYASFASKTDPSVAPDGCETATFLIPIAPGLEDTDAIRERYFAEIMQRLEHLTGKSVSEHVVFKRSYALREFTADYHSLRGNAYGLANTLRQTAFMRPSIASKRVRNLYFTGQLTVPGPGVPPALISGKIVADVALRGGKR